MKRLVFLIVLVFALPAYTAGEDVNIDPIEEAMLSLSKPIGELEINVSTKGETHKAQQIDPQPVKFLHPLDPTLWFAAGMNTFTAEYAIRKNKPLDPLFSNTWTRIGVNAGSAVGMTYLSHELRKRGHDGWAKFLSSLVIGFHTGNSMRNMKAAWSDQ